MARVVLGMAVPHSGMLGKSPETWLEDGDRDRQNKDLLWYRNKHWQYPELAEARKDQHLERFLTLEERRARSARQHKAMEVMRRAYQEHKPDVAIILGKDQKEIFTHTNPSLAIYTGQGVPNGPPQRPVWGPEQPKMHPTDPELALHLVKSLRAEFDITEIFEWPPNVWMKPPQPIAPHAYGFIYHQIMGDDPPPNVPIFLNCFYQPTQPPFRRVLKFGKALFEAIKAWDTDKTVAIIASGGLTHFVCDEEQDKVFIQAFRDFDFERLAAIDERTYQSGTSEVKLYAPVLVAMAELGFPMNLVEYVPCYRTEAGTGEGFGYMYWAQPK
jgi:3-O-methylgallate 3,4-dioxygenase